ncbi:MAG: helix-turn-helix domain-containing protein, partial [Nitrospirae bacterium]|nr:helix-turn-helix domain-containing protein [Nitrospirota bacterium]
MLLSLRTFDDNETAKQRMKIIKFYDAYGEKAAIEAFGADRKVISRWRKRLKGSGGSLESLIPCSTKPKNLRRPKTPDWIVKFVRALREVHPRLGKEKIKPLLDKYCAKQGLKTVSESTIGNVIKRHKLFCAKTGKVYHNPSSGWAKNKAGKKTKRLRIKHPIRPNFSYPNCPKINAYIERYNRTVQEEFIDYNLDVINDKPVFHRRLADYL